MAINQLTTANTFQQWLVATQSLISVANNLTDGGTSSTFYANTNVQIGGDLTVTGNITLEAVGYDNLEVSGDLNVVGNSTLATANVTSLIGTANTAIYDRILAAEATSLAFSIALG